VDDLRREYEDRIKEISQGKNKEKLSELESENLGLNVALESKMDEISAFKEQVGILQNKILQLSNEAGDGCTVDSSQEHPIHVNQLPSSPQADYPNEDYDLIQKLTRAEIQAQHSTLEYQLLNMKYQKLIKKVRDLCPCELLSPTDAPSEVTRTAENRIRTSLVGSMEVDFWSDEAYDPEVKGYLTSRINDLIGQLQFAQSKANTFQEECSCLSSLLSLSCGHRGSLEEKLFGMEKSLADLSSELLTTKTSYEVQLLTMTEHVANMNDKLTRQQDTIEQLKLNTKKK